MWIKSDSARQALHSLSGTAHNPTGRSWGFLRFLFDLFNLHRHVQINPHSFKSFACEPQAWCEWSISKSGSVYETSKLRNFE